MYILPTIVTAIEIGAIFSRKGLPRSFLRSPAGSWETSGQIDRDTTSAGGGNAAEAFAARSSGVPFLDRRGLRENAARVTL